MNRWGARPTGDCPCGSGDRYASCCGLLHDGTPAPTAERLMRARYAAHVLGRSDYLFRSWHPRTRPEEVTVSDGMQWTGLTVLRSVGGDPEDEHGLVEFEAGYTTPQGNGTLRETSLFERRRGGWVYVEADET